MASEVNSQMGRQNHMRFIVLTLLILSSACSSGFRVRVEPNLKDDRTSLLIHHEFIFLSKFNDRKIEIFWMRPEVEGPFPTIIALHGNQDPERPGGAIWIHGFLQRMVDDRMAVVAISQPGYGNSDGPPDYAGPVSQDAVLEVIQYFKKQSWVNPTRIGIFGIGRGATLAGLVAEQEPGLAALVLQAGVYDLPTEFDSLKTSKDKEDRAHAEQIEKEIGRDTSVFTTRSVVEGASQIRASTLILVGAKDYAPNVRAAHELETELQNHKTPVRLVEVKTAGHAIPVDKRIDVVDPFLEDTLLYH